MHGQYFTAWSVRGNGPHQRVVLGVDRVERPGLEADKAVEVFRSLHEVAGSGIQAVVYDRAMRRVHIDEIMTGCRVVVINKVHASAKTAARRGQRPAVCRRMRRAGPQRSQASAGTGSAVREAVGTGSRSEDPRVGRARRRC